MPQLYYDLFFTATLIVILMAIIRISRHQGKAEREALGKIMIGILFLTGFSLVQLLGHQNAFARVPYLQQDLNRKMVEAIGIVGGLLFVLVGIGALLPSLSNIRRLRRKMHKRYICLKMINQVVAGEAALDDVCERVMNCLATYLGLPKWAAFTYSSKKEMLFLTGSVGFVEPISPNLRQIASDDGNIRASLLRFRAVVGKTREADEADGPRPDILVPVAHSGRLYGALFGWSEELRVDDDLIDFLTLVGDTLGRHAQARVNRVKTDYYRSQYLTMNRVSAQCTQANSIGSILGDLMGMVREATGSEYLSAAVLDASGENMVRYTIGTGGRMLLEKGVSRSTRGGEIFRMYRDGQPVLLDMVEPGDHNGEEDGLFLSCGMRSKLAIPIMTGQRVMAVITLGHPQPGHFTRIHLNRLGHLLAPLAGVIQREQLTRTVEVKEDQMLRLQLLERDLVTNGSAPEIFDTACDLLTRRMKATMARISLVDSEEKHLISQACRTIRRTSYDLKPSATVPLSLLPWHRMTVEARKLMLINQTDPQSQMPPQELSSVLLPEIKSAILVPIMLNDRVAGLVSVGEARNWNRRSFGAADLIFAKDVAAKCSLALRITQLEGEAERFRTSARMAEPFGRERRADIAFRLKSPLTSIMGAVELLKSQGDPDPRAAKYHTMILKAADRIQGMTEEFATQEPDEVIVSPDQVLG